MRGRIAGSLVPDLAAAVATRAEAAAAGVAPPTHGAFGARIRLSAQGEDADALALDVEARVDARQLPLAGTAAAPPHPTPAFHLLASAGRRDGGWLAGGPLLGLGARVRRLEIGADLVPAGGSAAVVPVLRLYDAAAGGGPAWLDLDGLVSGQPPLPALLQAAGAVPGSPESLLADSLGALGLGAVGEDGGLRLDLAALAAAAAQPIAVLGPRLRALLDAAAGPLGLETAPGPTWTLRSGLVPIEVTLAGPPWSVRACTFDVAGGGDLLPLAPGLALAVDVALALPALAGSGTGRVELASARLDVSSAGVSVAVAPWLPPVALLPAPPAAAVREALVGPLPLALASAAITATVSALAGGGARILGVERLLASPGGWFLAPEGMGAADGSGFDPARVASLLDTLARALDLPGEGGLRLPGGVTVAAAGADPLVVTAAGVLPLAAGAGALDLRLSISIDRSLSVVPAGSASLRLPLPGGTWSEVEIALGAGASGLSLAVRPANGEDIDLLPAFGGFGSLAPSPATLLPAVLQAMVDALAPQPAQASGPLRAALEVARALGTYDFDAAGFEEPARAAELAAMLEPGWLASRAASGPAVAAAMAAALGGPGAAVALPGTVRASGPTVRWELPLGASASFSATAGWSAGEPTLAVGVLDALSGPLLLERLRFGYEGGVTLEVIAGLRPGGDLAFLAPDAVLALSGGAPAVDFFPLGRGGAADLAVRLSPVPSVTAGAGAARALVEGWGAPLAAVWLMGSLETRLGAEVWEGGPTARSVLEEAGIARPGSAPLRPAIPLPPPADAALRALRALSDEATVPAGTGLTVDVVRSGGRTGVRLRGRQALGSGSPAVSLELGDADWLDDPDAGATLWLLEDASGPVGVRLAPGSRWPAWAPPCPAGAAARWWRGRWRWDRWAGTSSSRPGSSTRPAPRRSASRGSARPRRSATPRWRCRSARPMAS